MRYFHGFCVVLSSALIAACATPPQPNENPQNLNDTPDLSAFRNVELSANSNGKRENAPARFVANGAYLDLQIPDANSQRLYVQVEACRDSADAHCARRYILSGELAAFSSKLKCYVPIRNDANSGYIGQALQGLCQDQHSRSYSITISK
jgi:hypothetical protein